MVRRRGLTGARTPTDAPAPRRSGGYLKAVLVVGLWVAWSLVFIQAFNAVEHAWFGDDVAIIYSDDLVPGQATITACRPDHPTPYTCTARIRFDPRTTRGDDAPQCQTSEVRSPRSLQGVVPVIGHYRQSGRIWHCTYATTTDYPRMSPDRERSRNLLSYAATAVALAGAGLILALFVILDGRRQRSATRGAGRRQES